MTTYQPTKNYFKARLDGTLKEFREAAEKVALEEFIQGLQLDGCNSVEEFKNDLLTWEEGELLTMRSYAQEDENEQEELAAHPGIEPTVSFWHLVRSSENAFYAQYYDEALKAKKSR